MQLRRDPGPWKASGDFGKSLLNHSSRCSLCFHAGVRREDFCSVSNFAFLILMLDNNGTVSVKMNPNEGVK